MIELLDMDVQDCQSLMRRMSTKVIKRLAHLEMNRNVIVGLGGDNITKKEVLRMRQALEYVINYQCKFERFRSQVDGYQI